MSLDEIVIKGAREHNLKNVDVVLPRNKLVVITGVSGSGKSSLAFDTVYAEGRRRYVESLSAYARQFLGRIEKPDVDYIEGLSPAISIDQKGTSHNPRSTVGTVTEIYDYLRLLFARIGDPHCPSCGRPVQRQTVEEIVDSVVSLTEGARIMILAPVVRDRKGEHKGIFEEAAKKGFSRLQVDGVTVELASEIYLDKKKRHSIDIIVDRLVVDQHIEYGRVHDSVETAMRLGKGIVIVSVLPVEPQPIEGNVSLDIGGTGNARRTPRGKQLIFSEEFSCPYCNLSLGAIEPRSFSFNSPHGACPACTGLGFTQEIDADLIMPNKNLSLSDGAIQPWERGGVAKFWYTSLLESIAREHGFSTEAPISQLSPDVVDLILHGDQNQQITMHHLTRKGKEISWKTYFPGVIPNLERRYRETSSEYFRTEIQKYMTKRNCPSCEGKRLKPESLSVQICEVNIMDVCGRTIESALKWVAEIQGELIDAACPQNVLNERQRQIGRQILKEIESRLRFLFEIGLDYLSLDRNASTLSGGEAQRIRLATQIGSGLMGVLYVCDEPTIGLHPADDYRLIDTLKRLRDLGNTVIMVEHDEAVMRSADFIVDMGPGAGEAGGNVVATGTLEEIKQSPQSITGDYLAGRRVIPVNSDRRPGNGKSIKITGARANNLQSVDVSFPLGRLVCVTGVSGSGKSTLINEILYKKLAQVFYRVRDKPGDHESIDGIEAIDKVVNIDQSPIGRTPRSNPATYTGAFTPIREMFAQMPESRARGYKPGRFSFNVRGGRCEACQGDGYIQIEMQFLPDVTMPCEVCHGARYNREALEVQYRGYSIAEVLQMTVDNALGLFSSLPKVMAKLETMRDVGLGYIRLGQPATTLSGGEAQRVKLSTELSKRSTGRTLYILDEPTTGLSFHDVSALLKVLHRLVDAGNTVIVIEHHLDVIKNADWVIDLGPGAGDKGGRVIATGTPEDLLKREDSITGQYLIPLLTSP